MFVLFVRAYVGKVGHDGAHRARAIGAQGIAEYKKFHHVGMEWGGGSLNDARITSSDIFIDFYEQIFVGKLRGRSVGQGHIECMADVLSQCGVGRAGKNFEFHKYPSDNKKGPEGADFNSENALICIHINDDDAVIFGRFFRFFRLWIRVFFFFVWDIVGGKWQLEGIGLPGIFFAPTNFIDDEIIGNNHVRLRRLGIGQSTKLALIQYHAKFLGN